MSKVTEGKWEVEHGFNVMCGNRSIASCGGYISNARGNTAHKENIANANLIAAAPDMYEALKSVIDYYNEHPSYLPDFWMDVIKAKRKAEGK